LNNIEEHIKSLILTKNEMTKNDRAGIIIDIFADNDDNINR